VPDPSEPQEPQQGPQIHMLPEEFAGKWANSAMLQRSPHEFTLDMIRMGPQFQQGQVVSRVSFSPLLLAELADLFNETWAEYTRDAGVPSESDEESEESDD
jgi:hypothetical protein